MRGLNPKPVSEHGETLGLWGEEWEEGGGGVDRGGGHALMQTQSGFHHASLYAISSPSCQGLLHPFA